MVRHNDTGEGLRGKYQARTGTEGAEQKNTGVDRARASRENSQLTRLSFSTMPTR